MLSAILTYFRLSKYGDMKGEELGTGLTNYSSVEIKLILRKHTEEIKELDLGRSGPVIDRKNMAVYFPTEDALKPSPEMNGLRTNLIKNLHLNDRSQSSTSLCDSEEPFSFTNFDKHNHDHRDTDSLDSQDDE